MITGKITKEEKVIIKRMRDKGKSYGEIAKVLNCKKARIQSYCYHNGMGGYIAKAACNPKMKLEAFLNNLNKNHPTFKYITGYTHSDSIVIVECTICKGIMEKNAQFARRNIKSKCIHCDEKECKEKEIQLLREKILKEAVIKTRAIKEVKTRRCIVCNSAYERKHKEVVCSIECRNRQRNRLKDIKRRGLRHNNITLNDVIKAEKNICYLCNSECDIEDYTITSEGHFIVGKRYPSIEHVIPVCEGGSHTWDNIKLAHHQCNSIKNRTILPLIAK